MRRRLPIRLAGTWVLACLGAALAAYSAKAGVQPDQGAAAPRTLADAGSGASRFDVLGVRLYMTAAEAMQALERSLPQQHAWTLQRRPCAGSPAGAQDCLSNAVLAGPTGVLLRFVEDVPEHPGQSVVTEIEASQEPRSSRSKPLFRRALLLKYGPPVLDGDVGMQWGRLGCLGGQPCLDRTAPLLESSNDEMVRLSDTGFAERKLLQSGQLHPRHAAAP